MNTIIFGEMEGCLENMHERKHAEIEDAFVLSEINVKFPHSYFLPCLLRNHVLSGPENAHAPLLNIEKNGSSNTPG